MSKTTLTIWGTAGGLAGLVLLAGGGGFMIAAPLILGAVAQVIYSQEDRADES